MVKFAMLILTPTYNSHPFFFPSLLMISILHQIKLFYLFIFFFLFLFLQILT
eukprot:UN10729